MSKGSLGSTGQKMLKYGVRFAGGVWDSVFFILLLFLVVMYLLRCAVLMLILDEGKR